MGASTRARGSLWPARIGEAILFDCGQTLLEAIAHIGPLRRRIWAGVKGPQVLEIGVGGGRSLGHYRENDRLVALDISSSMLALSAARAKRRARKVDLLLADAQRLPFRGGVFDTVIESFVFCEVDHPAQGLSEAVRVAHPDGRVLLMEHGRSGNPLLGRLLDLLDRFTAPRYGENLVRNIATDAGRAGLEVVRAEEHRLGIVKMLWLRRNGSVPVAEKGRTNVVAS